MYLPNASLFPKVITVVEYCFLLLHVLECLIGASGYNHSFSCTSTYVLPMVKGEAIETKDRKIWRSRHYSSSMIDWILLPAELGSHHSCTSVYPRPYEISVRYHKYISQ